MSRAPRKVLVLNCLDIQSWRAFSKVEMCDHLSRIGREEKESQSRKKRSSILAVKYQLSPVDIYCYLKARFGNPNGLQTFLSKDDSDNWIHWDYNIKVGAAEIHIAGTSRETHFIIDEALSDIAWRDLITNIKSDFQRVGKEKAAILKTLEKWVVFPNKFMEVAWVCADKHSYIKDYLEDRPMYQPLSLKGKDQKSLNAYARIMSAANKRRADMSQCALELSLLTPVMAEAYINMVILILCKREIRDNKRQFASFIRSDIDAKIFDLPYKCDGFVKRIEQDNDKFRNFKRVMDKRNHAIHGNIDPEKEQIETVYSEGKRPLYKEAGDHIGKFIESIERQAEPDVVLKDYEDTHEFLIEVASCLDPLLQRDFWRIVEDTYPGYDVGRKITGVLLPGAITMAQIAGLRYDDDLSVDWKS